MDISTALASITAAIDMARAGLEARDNAKVQSALIDVHSKLLSLSIACTSLSETNFALRQALEEANTLNRQLQAKAQERERYVPAEICPGSYAYASKPLDGRQNEPAHYLCQPCYDADVKSVLRHTPARTGVDAHWTCPANTMHRITHHGTAHRVNFRPSTDPYA
jgi:hypothetical protein